MTDLSEGLPHLVSLFAIWGHDMDLLEAASALSTIVEEEGPITGAHLSGRLRQIMPAWSPRNWGAPSLRAFIAQHVPSVVVARRAGLDLVYQWAPIPAGHGKPLPAGRANFWQIWVSPNAPYSLEIQKNSGHVQACTRTDFLSPGMVRIEQPSIAFHRQMALDFLEHLPSSIEHDVLRLLAEDTGNPSWWRPWFAALRKAGLGKNWNAFRTEHLQAALENQLNAATLSTSAVHAALTAIRPRAEKSTPAVHAVPNTPDKAPRSALQEIAIAAVMKMSDEELRELRLPLGRVVDATGAER